MVSRPTHKPIPIPLSVPVEDSEPFDSVDDLLASIRELVSPGAVDIIDLNRPVQSDLSPSRPVQARMHAQTGTVHPGTETDALGESITAPEHLDSSCHLGESEVFSSKVLTPHKEAKHYLSEKTLSESSKVLSSLMSALEEPEHRLDAHTDSSAQDFQKPIRPHNRDDGRMNGLRVEDLVAQCLKAPLGQWIGQNDAVISQHVKTIIEQHITELLHRWLDAHLPELIKASVDQHLDALIQSVRKQ